MINSKKITVFSVILTALVFIITLFAVLLPDSVFTGNRTGTTLYGDMHSVTYTEDDYYTSYSESSVAKINLLGNIISAKSTNVTVDGSTLTVLGGGTYVINGTLEDGSIVVDSQDGGVVRLILDNVSVTSSFSAPLYIKQAEKVIISLPDGSESTFSDSSAYSGEETADENITAALYSRDDLTVNGTGTLTVNGNYKDAIKVNDTLKITEGNLNITAVDDGINVNDLFGALAVSINITAGGDAIKCENEEPEKGFIAFSGTNVTITSMGDGIYSSSAIYLDDVIAQISAGSDAESVTPSQGGSGMRFQSQTADSPSTKAIKAGSAVTINGGTYTIASVDDSIHSDGDITVSDGDISVSCGDDAIHAEKNVTLSPNSLNITKCREGIEGAYVEIGGGDICIISTDDAINAVGENSSGGMGMPMGMRKENITDEDIYLRINGGNIHIETGGDGIDSNGAAEVNGGQVEVYGPEMSGNSSLDFEYGFIINGGSLLAAGSSGMAEEPSAQSGQKSIVFILEESYDSGAKITLADSSGNEIVNVESAKKFSWICISNDKIAEGEKYTLMIDGDEVASTETDGTVTTVGNKERGRW